MKEQQPLVIEENNLPIKIVAENSFHFSKPLIIKKYSHSPILIGIGCEVDNGRLWGGLLFSALLFTVFFVTRIYLLLLLANLPLVFLFYKYFLNPKAFITIEILKK